MPPLNTIVIDGVNTYVIDAHGVITHVTNLNTLADRLKYARAAKGWSQGELAKRAKLKAQGTIGNIESGIRQSKGSLPAIAEALGPPYSYKWLLEGGPLPVITTAVQDVSAEIPTNTGFHLSPGRRSLDNIPFHSAPITRWPKRGEELNNRLRLVGRMAAIPGQYSDQTQVIQVGEDAMKPEIEDGEFIAVDPLVSARNGDVVIVRDGLGDFHLRRFRSTMGGDFEAWPTNPHFATLDSGRHGLSVAAVMVCHMKLRHP